MPDFKYGDITEKIIGACFKVHSTLGNGFQEVIYQRALELELKLIPLDFAREFEMPIYYLDQHIGTRRVDFLIDNKISVELKAIIKLEDVHLAQAMNYLEAYNLEVGLLINFGSKRMEFHRLTNKKYDPSIFFSSQSSNKS
jgi:GxxExxY protein